MGLQWNLRQDQIHRGQKDIRCGVWIIREHTRSFRVRCHYSGKAREVLSNVLQCHDFQLIHTGSGRLLGSNEITFSSDGTNSTFRAMFKEPLEIQPNTNYTAVSTLKGLDSHYGTKGLRKVTVDCHNGGKVTFQFSYAAGNNNGTSVEDGQIPEVIFYT